MNRVLLDTDVILDKMLGRDPWLHESTALWDAIGECRIEAFSCTITPLNISYIVRRILGASEVSRVLIDLLTVVQTVPSMMR